ncbi:methyltransferase domain protein [Mycobacterium xenopi 4042]|uniref:Methyltransferase domain protein n=1 Tax=Mycobacterium xenopi 4042 TaxID=1299334 RepID=X8AHB6_MYCXE|nr:methyltransferase domain protein [Mycobacterium xenopi 4042]
MASRHTLFRVFYRLGFTPWDGHPQSPVLRGLIEGPDALPPGSALDVGCGTGDASIYLAQHGWQVTGVDFVPKALDKARAKAQAANVAVSFVRADVTHLRQAGIGSGFQVIVDNGCFHGMSAHDRDLYVDEISAAAAPSARLVMVAFAPAAVSARRASSSRKSNVASRPPGRCCRRPTNRAGQTTAGSQPDSTPEPTCCSASSPRRADATR